MFTLTQARGADEDLGVEQPYNTTKISKDDEEPTTRTVLSSSNRTTGTPPFHSNNITMSNRSRTSGSISGKPLYETTGDDDTVIFCTCTDSTLNVQFFPHAVVVRHRKKFCCFPSVKSTTIIPRYKITDVQTGAGGRSIPTYVWIMFMVSVLLLAIGALSSRDCTAGTYANNYALECEASGGGIAMIILGVLLLIPTIALMIYYMKGKDHYYILQYSAGRSGGSWFSSANQVYLESNEKPDEDFLYRYVYESVENTKDPQFLHRFSHLYRMGLMEPVKDKSTPDELTTALTTIATSTSRGRNGPSDIEECADF